MPSNTRIDEDTPMTLAIPRPSGHSNAKRAFTVVELLVVISIIVILMGILIPVASKVRQTARAADVKNQVARLSAMMQAYNNDFNAYPGPIPNTQLRGFTTNNITTPAMIGAKITMAENVYLGLMGGLKPATAWTAAAPVLEFDKNIAGQGPRYLSSTPKKLPPYGDNTDLTSHATGNPPVFDGHFVDGNDIAADDSDVPEFVDRFPDAMPFLILRARVGIVTTPNGPVVTALPSSTAQYDQTQVTPYTGATGGGYIGVGKTQDSEWTNLPFPNHGFNLAPDASLTTKRPDPPPATWTYPYNIHAALRHPTLADTPKQKDGYMIISAGIDRVYGTRDDITNFGEY